LNVSGMVSGVKVQRLLIDPGRQRRERFLTLEGSKQLAGG